MDTLAMNNIITSVTDKSVKAGRKVIVPVSWIRTATQDTEAIYFFPNRKAARAISRQYCEIKVAALGHPSSDLVNVGLGPS
jgi:hypothetical protein